MERVEREHGVDGERVEERDDHDDDGLVLILVLGFGTLWYTMEVERGSWSMP